MKRSELTWFKPDNYSNSRLDGLGPSGWSRVISFRLFLQLMHMYEPPEETLEGFGFVQNDPIDIPIWDLGQLPRDHFSDTASVQFVRAAPLANAVERLLKFKMDGRPSCFRSRHPQ